MAPLCYRRHRFPPEIIQHAIWLYLRFTLSYRDVEELLAERGLDISYETVRRWVLKFGPAIARRLRRAVRGRAIDGTSTRWWCGSPAERMYLWRAVDHEGEVLDMLVQRRRDTRAALRLMRKLLKKQGFAPKLLVTDKLRSYACAFRHLRLTCPHQQGLRQEQSGRELASSGPTTRAQDAAVQVGWICPALPQHSRCGPQHLQPATPPHFPIHPADLPSRSYRTVARCRRSGMTRGEFRLSLHAR